MEAESRFLDQTKLIADDIAYSTEKTLVVVITRDAIPDLMGGEELNFSNWTEFGVQLCLTYNRGVFIAWDLEQAVCVIRSAFNVGCETYLITGKLELNGFV